MVIGMAGYDHSDLPPSPAAWIEYENEKNWGYLRMNFANSSLACLAARSDHDLTAGAGADGVEDDILQALRGSSERLDADAGSLLACIAQQEQQLGELAMRLESLDAARQGLHGSTVASVMQGMAAVQEEKARDVAAAVTAGVETLLKTELGK